MADDLQQPSYSVAKVKDALIQISDLSNVTSILDEENVQLQGQNNDEIYYLSQNPRVSKAETLAFNVRTDKTQGDDPTRPERKCQKELYTVNETDRWLNPAHRAFLPPMYTFTAAAKQKLENKL